MKRFLFALLLLVVLPGCTNPSAVFDAAKRAVPGCVIRNVDQQGPYHKFVAVCPGGKVHVVRVHSSGGGDPIVSEPLFDVELIKRVVNQ